MSQEFWINLTPEEIEKLNSLLLKLVRKTSDPKEKVEITVDEAIDVADTVSRCSMISVLRIEQRVFRLLTAAVVLALGTEMIPDKSTVISPKDRDLIMRCYDLADRMYETDVDELMKTIGYLEYEFRIPPWDTTKIGNA
jgi:hypothetical protein